jgi:hypothetical protein
MELIAGIMVQQSVIQNLKAATSVFVWFPLKGNKDI